MDEEIFGYDSKAHLQEISSDTYAFVFINIDWSVDNNDLSWIPLDKICKDEAFVIMPVVGAAHSIAARLFSDNNFTVYDSSLTLMYPDKSVVCPQKVHKSLFSRKTTSENVWVAYRTPSSDTFDDVWKRVFSATKVVFPLSSESTIPAVQFYPNAEKENGRFYLSQFTRKEREEGEWQHTKHRKGVFDWMTQLQFLTRPDENKALFINMYPQHPALHDIWCPSLMHCSVIPGGNSSVMKSFFESIRERGIKIQTQERERVRLIKRLRDEDEDEEEEEEEEEEVFPQFNHTSGYGNLLNLDEEDQTSAEMLWTVSALSWYLEENRNMSRIRREKKRRRKENNEASDKKRVYSFEVPCDVNAVLAQFFNLADGEKLSRAESSRRMHLYIEANGLQRETDGRYIDVERDSTLKGLLFPEDEALLLAMWKKGVPENMEDITFFMITNAIGAFLTRSPET